MLLHASCCYKIKGMQEHRLRSVGMCRIRDKIDKMMQKDRALSLLIAMESALEDDRFEVRLSSPAQCGSGVMTE